MGKIAKLLLALSLVYMLCEELINIVISVAKEVQYRVFLS